MVLGTFPVTKEHPGGKGNLIDKWLSLYQILILEYTMVKELGLRGLDTAYRVHKPSPVKGAAQLNLMTSINLIKNASHK